MEHALEWMAYTRRWAAPDGGMAIVPPRFCASCCNQLQPPDLPLWLQPYAVAVMGWVAGPLLVLLAAWVTLFTSLLLAECFAVEVRQRRGRA